MKANQSVIDFLFKEKKLLEFITRHPLSTYELIEGKGDIFSFLSIIHTIEQ
jgi:hypothetical protein